MKYRSTRGGVEGYSFEEAVLAGLAADGGLFIPTTIPTLPDDWRSTWSQLPFQQLAHRVLSLFIDDSEIPAQDLEVLIAKSYSTFRHEQVTPLHKVRQGFYVLELFHGPTFAFKDVALQFVGNLFEYFLERKNKGITDPTKLHRITVVGATSGDTGSAAIYGLRNKKNVSVFILHPKGRVSPIQEAQMTTVKDPNVHNLAVKGTFDDCQDIVKALFSNVAFNQKHQLGAVNSINWARILAQTVYYFYAYFTLCRQLNIDPASPEADKIKVHFSVPTGNFGDVLAGYYAHQMGLPTAKLIVATNANDILYRFFNTNAYEKHTGSDGGVKVTLSPAMDILVSSNFERLLWYLVRETEPDQGADMVSNEESERDARLAKHAGSVVNGWMADLKAKGRFEVAAAAVKKAREIFDTANVSDEQTLETIRAYYKPTNPNVQPSYIVDPHTAVGIFAADTIIRQSELSSYPNGPDIMITLATAHPAKFSGAVQAALASEPEFDFDSQVLPPEFDGLLDMERRVVDVDIASEEAVAAVIEQQLASEGVAV